MYEYRWWKEQTNLLAEAMVQNFHALVLVHGPPAIFIADHEFNQIEQSCRLASLFTKMGLE